MPIQVSPGRTGSNAPGGDFATGPTPAKPNGSAISPPTQVNPSAATPKSAKRKRRMKVAVNAQAKTVSVSYADHDGDVVALSEDEYRPCAFIDRALFAASSEGSPKRVWIQLCKVGAFKGHAAGEFSLDPKVFDEIVRNFKATENRAIPIDFEHASESDAAEGDIPTRGAPAQGWVYDLDNRGQDGLWGLVEWGDLARTYIQNGQYRFISPAIRFGARDRVTGKPIGARMTSAGLTNQPFLDGMAPMAAKDAAQITETDRDLEDVAAAIAAALSDNTPDTPANKEDTMSDATESAEVRLKLKDAEARVASLEAEVKALRDEKSKREDEDLRAEVEAAYLSNKDVKRLSDADKADMFVLARANRESFRKLFPSVPAHQRHLTQNVAASPADKPEAERTVMSRDDVPDIVKLTNKYVTERGMSLEDATIKAYDKVKKAERALLAQGGR